MAGIGGTQGADRLDGTEDRDSIYGFDGDDIINGLGGSDFLVGMAGSDIVSGGAGDDTIVDDRDDGSADVFIGGAGSDRYSIVINGGHTRIIDDRADGDNNVLDVLSVTRGWVIDANSGTGFTDGATVEFTPGSIGQIFGSGGDDRMTTHKNGTRIDGSDGNDVLIGNDGADRLLGNVGNDIVDGRAGDDVLDAGVYFGPDLGDRDQDVFIGGAGVDTIDYSGGYSGKAVVVSLAITGRQNTIGRGVDDISQVENLIGSSLDDVLTGSDINNRVEGGMGNDIIEGLGGNDILIGGDYGFDEVSYAHAASAVTVDLSRETAQNTQGAGVDTLTGFERISGSIYGDRLTGGVNTTVLNGGRGNDVIFSRATFDESGFAELFGGDGDDILHSLSDGGDRLFGGAGFDTASFSRSTIGVAIDLRISETQPIDVMHYVTLDEIEALEGSAFADRLTGNVGANRLQGGAGDDLLVGGLGDDVLDGGTGIDTASYTDAASGVTVNLRLATRQNTLGAGIDTLVGIETLEGSAFNDRLSGNGGTNILIGGAGIDVADYAGAAAGVRVSLAIAGRQHTGGDGVDTLTGFEHLNGSRFDDQLTGDAGTNELTGNAGDDLLSGGLGDDLLSGGAGIDTASYAGLGSGVTVSLDIAAAQDTLGGGVDTLVGIEALVGTGHADRLTGNASANRLSGGGGDDLLVGGLGEDLLDGGAGIDRASYADAASGVSVNLRLATRQNTLGAGVDTLVEVEQLEGSGFDDTLSGNAGTNVLIGGGGIDTVDYAGAAAGVRVSLAIAGRQNTVGDGVDTLTAIENLNGSAFADQLTGDAGNNRLIGNAGFDILVGGLGDDFLSGGADHDVASYAGLGTGVTVNLGITTAQDTLGGGIDTLVGIEGLVGTNHADRLTGNAFGNGINGGGGDDVIDAGGGSGPDFLSGGTGNDVIKGGGGADNLLGDAGADILTGGAGNDNFEYNLASESRIGSGVDRITDFAMGDILDISEVDANALTTGIDENEAFVLVTSFTQTAGELTLAFDAGSNTTTLLGDTNGDGVGDFSILFTGNVASAITANWVLLSD